MSHFTNNPQDSDRLKKIVGNNPLTKQLGDNDKEHVRYEAFEAVSVLTNAARQLYCEGDMKFDDMIVNLCKALDKLKGKEKTLAKESKGSESVDSY